MIFFFFLLSVKIIKPANEKQGKNVLNKRFIKQPKNSWISIKRSELPQQMELLVPFLIDVLGVEIPFQSVLKDCSKV